MAKQSQNNQVEELAQKGRPHKAPHTMPLIAGSMHHRRPARKVPKWQTELMVAIVDFHLLVLEQNNVETKNSQILCTTQQRRGCNVVLASGSSRSVGIA